MKYPAGLNDVYDFGKFKDRKISEVLIESPTYVEWCIDNVKDFELTDEAFEEYETELESYREKEEFRRSGYSNT